MEELKFCKENDMFDGESFASESIGREEREYVGDGIGSFTLGDDDDEPDDNNGEPPMEMTSFYC
jgi:hypothetical protein